MILILLVNHCSGWVVGEAKPTGDILILILIVHCRLESQCTKNCNNQCNNSTQNCVIFCSVRKASQRLRVWQGYSTEEQIRKTHQVWLRWIEYVQECTPGQYPCKMRSIPFTGRIPEQNQQEVLWGNQHGKVST